MSSFVARFAPMSSAKAETSAFALILGEPRFPQPLGGLERVERDHAGIVRARRRRGNGRGRDALRRGA